MRKTLKLFGKLFFFLLLAAVALRPVVVDLSPSNPIPVSSFSQNGFKGSTSHKYPNVATAQITKAAAHVSTFKFIPKEFQSFNLLTPKFTKTIDPFEPRFCAVPGSVFNAVSHQSSLVLRI
jgi:hypothetical protein